MTAFAVQLALFPKPKDRLSASNVGLMLRLEKEMDLAFVLADTEPFRNSIVVVDVCLAIDLHLGKNLFLLVTQIVSL